MPSIRKFLGKSCQGTIKSFVLEKRYGFISGDQFDEDVFVNYKLCPNLQDYGDAVCAGARVTFIPTENPSKKGSFEAQSCELNEDEEVDSSANVNKWVDCTVKSWVPATGWGFLTSKRAAGDIMVSARRCPELSTMPLQKGMGVRAKFAESASGKLEATDVELKTGTHGASQGMGMQAAGMQQAAAMAAMMPQFAMFMNMLSGGAMGGMGPAMGSASGFGPMTGQRKAASTASPYASQKSKKFIGKTVTGTIKSFYAVKGYGFVNAKSFTDDCFFNIKLNPHLEDVMDELKAGLAVKFTVQEGRNGALEATDIEEA